MFIFTKQVSGFPALCALLAASLLAASANAQFQDARAGFRVDPPANWKQVASGLGENWILAKFQCDKLDISIDNTFGEEHRPEMLIFAFPTGDEKSPFRIEYNNPFANYTAWLEKKYGSEYRFETEKKETPWAPGKAIFTDVRTIPGDRYGQRSAKRILSTTYKLQDLDILVQFEVLESALTKRQVEIDTAFRSFKSIPRTENNKNAPPRTAMSSLEDLLKLTPEERKTRRVAMADAAIAKLKTVLPDGWTASPEGRFFVLNHSDQKFMLRVVAQGNAIFDWLDKNLDFIGKGEFVRKPLLRIFADSQESRSAGASEMWVGGSNLEIVMYKDEDDGIASPAFHEFNKSAFRHWIHERDTDFAITMPEWLSSGLYQIFEYGRLKDGSFIFPVHVYELESLREIVRLNKVQKVRDIMMNLAPETDSWRGKNDQRAALVRFFLSGNGSKDAKFRDFFRNYIKNYRAAVADARKAGVTAAKGEGAQDYKNRLEFWKGKLTSLSEKAAEQTFSTLRDAEWKALDLAFFNSLTIQ